MTLPTESISATDGSAALATVQVAMTSTDSAALPEDEKLARLQAAKGGSWYDGWKPYCLTCDASGRMIQRPYGFQCSGCLNMISWDLTRLADSPLNRHR